MGVERDDDGGAAWEVEVEKPDGSEVEVRLTSDLKQVGVGARRRQRSRRARARARTATDRPAPLQYWRLMKRIAILAVACCAAASSAPAATTTPATARTTSDDRVRRHRVDAAAGQRAGGAGPGRLHDQDRQPLLADGAGATGGCSRSDGGADRRRGHEPEEGRSPGSRPLVVRDTVTDNNGDLVEVTDDWYAQDRTATSGTWARTSRTTRTARWSRPAGSWEHGVDGAYARHRDPGRAAARAEVPPGVLQGRGGGRGQGAERDARP